MRLNKTRKFIRKNTKGITLVALVVTIIVLIILAGVSISLILGNNGIISKAQEARTNYQLAANEEQTKIDEFYGQLQLAADGTVTMDMNTLNELMERKINDTVGQTIQEMQDTITALQSNQTPVGTIISYSTATVPSGYLECNGQVVSRETYSALFSKIGTTYGAGDGSTTFRVPDLRGEFLRGTGTNSSTGHSGANVGTHQKGSDVVGGYFGNGGGNAYIGINLYYTDMGNKADNWVADTQYPKILNCDATDGYKYSGTIGKGTSRPTNTSVLYCIKY